MMAAERVVLEAHCPECREPVYEDQERGSITLGIGGERFMSWYLHTACSQSERWREAFHRRINSVGEGE